MVWPLLTPFVAMKTEFLRNGTTSLRPGAIEMFLSNFFPGTAHPEAPD